MTTRSPGLGARGLTVWVTCSRGAEDVLAAELASLVPTLPMAIHQGRVVLRHCSHRQLIAIVRRAWTAERVWLEVHQGMARTFHELETSIASVDWTRWLRPGDAVHVAVDTHRSRLHHTGAVAERVVAAIAATCATVPASDGRVEPTLGQVIRARLDHDRLAVLIDASGAPTAERGWRAEPGMAPLSASVVWTALNDVGWDPSRPLVDPMCGSGSFVIEAARAAAGRPVSEVPRLALWPDLNRGAWASVDADLRGMDVAMPLRVAGSDVDEDAIARAMRNAERAGVSGIAQFRTADVRAAVVTLPGAVVAVNPPWGRRFIEPDTSVWEGLERWISGRDAVVVSTRRQHVERLLHSRTHRVRVLRHRGVTLLIGSSRLDR